LSGRCPAVAKSRAKSGGVGSSVRILIGIDRIDTVVVVRVAVVETHALRAQDYVWRAWIILAAAQGCGTMEIMRRAGVYKPCLSLAAALHGGVRRRPAARQDTKARQGAGSGPGCGG
jgi:hypothetical protein